MSRTEFSALYNRWPSRMTEPVVLLGLGFTTQRLARKLCADGVPVFAAVRGPERFAEFEALGVRFCPLRPEGIPRGAALVHTIPPLNDAEKSATRTLIREISPRRILYISSTSVYGAQDRVSETSPVAPIDDKGAARVDEEEWIASPQAPWTSLILRSAAIYGPGRGIQVRLREGKFPRGAGGVVSRIHVDDLAALLGAGIRSELTGAWPVADGLPAASEEVAAWCAEFIGWPLPDASTGFPVVGRSVDGTAIRKLLGVSLKYSSYQTGIPASLREEGWNPRVSRPSRSQVSSR